MPDFLGATPVKISVNSFLTAMLNTDHELQYDGSNNDLDWRMDFRYLYFICIIEYLRSRLIKGCSTCDLTLLRLHNF